MMPGRPAALPLLIRTFMFVKPQDQRNPAPRPPASMPAQPGDQPPASFPGGKRWRGQESSEIEAGGAVISDRSPKRCKRIITFEETITRMNPAKETNLSQELVSSKAKVYRFSVVIERDKDGYFAFSPELQGCYSQGDTSEESLENIRDAIRLHVEDRLESGEEVPQPESVSLTSLEVTV